MRALIPFAALAVLWVLQATMRGWWVQDHADAAYTAETLKHTRQSESTDHYWDGA